MTKIILKNKFLVTMVLCFTLALSCLNAFAWGHGGHGGGRYYWHGDRWWGSGWFGFDVAVSTLAIGAVVEGLPYGYTTVVVGGVPYYYYENAYFRPYPAGGYVVVQQPVGYYQVAQSPTIVQSATPIVAQQPAVVAEPAAATSNAVSLDIQEEFTVNIPNARGGYTPVTLKRSRNGFIGPQGEFYPEFPKVRLLKVMYGK